MKSRNKILLATLVILFGVGLILLSQGNTGADSTDVYQSSVGLAVIYLSLGVGCIAAGVITLVFAFYKER